MTSISGAKGGGGGGSVTNTPDTLRSADTVEVILGLCEGPIYGLEEGDKSFYVGDTVLQNDDGTYNFSAVKLIILPGADNDRAVTPVLGGVSNNAQVNVQLANNVAVTRQTNSGDIDYIELRLAFQQLYKSNTSGTFTETAKFTIEYKALSAPTWEKPFGDVYTVKGKTTSTYVKELRMKVNRISEPYLVRVSRVNAPTSTEYICSVSWESFQEITVGSKRYLHTAIAHLTGKSTDQFSSIPQWSGIYKGLLVKVPSNYNPTTRVYTGVWNGTFQVAWTDNPAWILYDFIMNDRYGIKSYYTDVSIDKYDVYDAGKWCDELVPNGQGGYQPRYTFNAYLSEPKSGRELARYIAGTFNAMYSDDLNGNVFLKVDKDDSAVAVFTPENVINGDFEYSYTDISSRYNDITVTFRNPELNWAEDRRRVKDDTLIAKNGRVTLDFIAVGCIDAHEAIRRAQYKIITANTETCVVSFKTNRLGQFVQPFDVILIADPDMGYGLSGRVKNIDSTRKVVSLRSPVYLEAGIVNYTCQFNLSDGTTYSAICTGDGVGYNYNLYFTSALPTNIPEKGVFNLSNATTIGTPRPFRVMKVIEDDGNPDSISIEAINLNRNKWYDADNVTSSGVIQYALLPNPLNPPGPSSCSFTETYVKDSKEFHIIVNPTFDRGAYKYYTNDHSFEVWSRRKNSTEEFEKQPLYYGDTLINHRAGLMEFKVLGKSYLGSTTNITSATSFEFNVTNPKDPPAAVDWVKQNSNGEVYWGYTNIPSDLAGFKVRYQNQSNNHRWDDALPVHDGVITTNTIYTNLIPASARVILVKAVDAFGIESTEAKYVVRSAITTQINNILEQVDLHPTFSGTLVGCSVISGELLANDTSNGVYSGNPTALMYPNSGGLFYTSTYNTMTYSTTITLTRAGRLVPKILFDGSGYDIQIKPAADTIWQPLPSNMQISAGTYDVIITIPGGGLRGAIYELSFIVDTEDIYESVLGVTVSSTGLVRIPLTKTYEVIKLVTVSIRDDGVNSPTSYIVMDKNTTLGPQIKLLDASNAVSAGLVDVNIEGY